MLYSEIDRTQVTAELKKRRWVTVLPAAALVLLAIASFVWFRAHRDAGGWVWTGLLTVAGGAYFLFFYEVYLRPVSLYRKHVGYMLDGRQRETVGVLTAVHSEVQDKDGLDCISFILNVGDAQNAEDDRLFYLDALKSGAVLHVGSRFKVLSNDRMVSGIESITEEC